MSSGFQGFSGMDMVNDKSSRALEKKYLVRDEGITSKVLPRWGCIPGCLWRTGDPAGRDASITLVGRIASIRIAIAGQKDDLGRAVSVLPLCIVLCPTSIVSIFAYHVEMWNKI